MEKIAKTPFVGEHDRFEGRAASGDKNQYNLFCRHRRSEYFSFNNFFEKNNIFQNNFSVGINILNIFHLTTFSKKQYFPK